MTWKHGRLCGKALLQAGRISVETTGIPRERFFLCKQTKKQPQTIQLAREMALGLQWLRPTASLHRAIFHRFMSLPEAVLKLDLNEAEPSVLDRAQGVFSVGS
ncbi:unnamed protein product [Gadus morhua 'NCC']